ncbi:M4 family metallopeptidase [Legionella spiritensis]|uniref:Neutral metalloproteinase n=1 Tax=Legionella spiritensis TaxID=452 RepID=A0A0W0YVY7_LEGSP|nr:M4 family metallopeptidase [Legionella spiritensis]KTD61077.1 hemagglutinin/protease, zinc metalloprotease [Legionella spiritensis]SNV44740.1 hemagglutinin/protease, zinc metalloprotease [Legionella spiritensis]
MIKKAVLLTLASLTQSALATHAIDLYQAPVASLDKFPVMQQSMQAAMAKTTAAPENNQLKTVNLTRNSKQLITRYQQYYKGIPVIGAQVMVVGANGNGLLSSGHNAIVNGHLVDEININTHPAVSSQQALAAARTLYLTKNPQTATGEGQVRLQIRPDDSNQLGLVYQVSFKTMTAEGKPLWPFFLVDAQSGRVIKQWNNIKTYDDTGPGGNEKTREYWYGKDGLPPLQVIRKDSRCVMDDNKVRMVHLRSSWDWYNQLLSAYDYECGNNIGETTNGAFSPGNDAYYFGHVIVDMYKKWYGLNALQLENGTPMTLIMRVHFGQGYDNAFWDGETMSFGDGEDFYPLVSLDVAGHEVTHGFTEQHSDLEYHDQSGALNESVSDMAGQAARAYLLEQSPDLYNKISITPDEVTWGIGETIVKDSFGKALRFMDYPSADGSSADCLDKSLARSTGTYCAISYNDLIAFAEAQIPDPEDRQDFIVHTASGVFNKAFYLLSRAIGIKKAYHVMILANTRYWTPTTDFMSGACGVMHAANDLKLDPDVFRTVFNQVGVDTTHCPI